MITYFDYLQTYLEMPRSSRTDENASLNNTVTSRKSDGTAKKPKQQKQPKQTDPQQADPQLEPLQQPPVVNNNNSNNNNVSIVNVKKDHEEKKENSLLTFVKKNPVITVLILAAALVLVILAIVLPIVLVKPQEERQIEPRCPDGKNQPRVDCLPDKLKLSAKGSNLQSACSSRGCCWSVSPESGGPNCAFPTNFGFRNFKVKEHSYSAQWIELLRMNSPNSMAKSDIANLEVRAEMQSDTRMRIKVG